MWIQEYLFNPKSWMQKFKFEANQKEAHFPCVRGAGLKTLAGMVPFQNPSYVTLVFTAEIVPKSVVWCGQAGMGVGLLWCPQGADYFLFCF